MQAPQPDGGITIQDEVIELRKQNKQLQHLLNEALNSLDFHKDRIERTKRDLQHALNRGNRYEMRCKDLQKKLSRFHKLAGRIYWLMKGENNG